MAHPFVAARALGRFGRRVACAAAVLGAACAFAQDETAAAPPAPPADAEVAPAPVPVPATPRWVVRLPAADPVVFRGAENFDTAGTGAAPMLYPAPSAAGLLAVVLVHGLMNESAKSAQKAKLQEQADQVLVPYRKLLAAYTHAELAQGAPAPASVDGQAWQVDSAPVFSLTQDQQALVLDNVVSVRRAGSAGAAAYESVVRIVSAPTAEADPVAYWSKDNGAAFRAVAGALMRESIELAVSMADKTMPAGAAAQKTFRYFEGGTERVERASLVFERCARRVLLTLRETLMSVPLAAGADACAAVAAKAG